jgi:hypothetical protein
MADIIQFRYDTQTNWASVNPKLAVAERGLEIDTGRWKTGNVALANWNDLPYDTIEGVTETTGTVISFTAPTIYNTAIAPATGNITNNLTGAKVGIVQKIYHNHSSEPGYPTGWVPVGGAYTPNALNIIYAEFAKGTRVEYWIIKGQI